MVLKNLSNISGAVNRCEVYVALEVKTKKPASRSVRTGMRVKTGDDLLSHGLSPYYHRRERVSLPSSERDRVVPRCYDHQIATFMAG